MEMFENLADAPSDVIAAWIFTAIAGMLVIIWVLKKRKLPVIGEKSRRTNDRKVGTLYILFGLIFCLRAGIDSLFIRMQLISPNNDFWVFQADKYNEVFT